MPAGYLTAAPAEYERTGVRSGRGKSVFVFASEDVPSVRRAGTGGGTDWGGGRAARAPFAPQTLTRARLPTRQVRTAATRGFCASAARPLANGLLASPHRPDAIAVQLAAPDAPDGAPEGSPGPAEAPVAALAGGGHGYRYERSPLFLQLPGAAPPPAAQHPPRPSTLFAVTAA